MLGRLAIAIGEVGGNIAALEGFEVKTAASTRTWSSTAAARPTRTRSGRRSRARRRRDPRVRGPHLQDARGRQDRGAAPGARRRRGRPLHGLHAGCGPGLHGDRGRTRARPTTLHDQEEHRRHRLRRHRGARPGRHRPGGGHAGHGGQGAAVQALRRRRRLPDLPRHARTPTRSSRPCSASRRPSVASTSRTSPRPACFEVEERLEELLDIPVFHDDQHGTAVVVLAALRERAEDRRQEDGRPQGRHRRRRCGRRGRAPRSS